jgi:hypothetical protein
MQCPDVLAVGLAAQEDALLTALVDKDGDNDWQQIARSFSDRCV